MAQINISDYEVAEKFGLVSKGEVEDETRRRDEWPMRIYKYHIIGHEFEIEHCYYNCSTQEEANE